MIPPCRYASSDPVVRRAARARVTLCLALPAVLLACAASTDTLPARAVVLSPIAEFTSEREPLTDSVFASPIDVQAGAGGDLFVLDESLGSVRVMSTTTGQLLHAWGATGDGPGEFRAMGGIRLIGDSSLLFVDPRSRKVIRTGLRGELKEEYRFPNVAATQAIPDQQGRLHLVLRPGAEPSPLATVLSVSGSEPLFSYGTQEGYADPDERLFRNAHRVSPSRDGGVWAATRYSGRVQRFDSLGALSLAVTIPLRTGQDTAGPIISRPADNPNVFGIRRIPVIDDIVELPDGSLLISSFWRTEDREDQSRIFRMNRAGETADEALVPFRADKITVRGDTLFVLSREGRNPAAIRLLRIE